jgi:hypothetical protein
MSEPGIGHNQPSIFERIDELVANCNRWLVERLKIANAEQAGQASTFTEQLRAARDDLDAAFAAEKEPIDLMLTVLRIRFKPFSEKLAIALASMEAKSRDWLQRERERLQAEKQQRAQQANEAILEAAQAQADAEKPGATVEQILDAKHKNARAAELTADALDFDTTPHAKGDMSKRAQGLRSNWRARVIDAPKAIAYYTENVDVRSATISAIEKVATKQAKAQKGKAPIPPGVAFWNDERAS